MALNVSPAVAHNVAEVAANVFAVTGPASNFVIVRDGEAFSLFDCGYPKDERLVNGSLAYLGLAAPAAAGLLVTHAHNDHIGSARGLSRLGVPVWCSPDELANLTGESRHQVGFDDIYRHLWKPRFVLWTCRAVLAGGLQPCTLPADRVNTFDYDAPLDLPGSPVPLSTPGHTPGHTSYLLPQTGTLVAGDALVTAHAVTRRRGPQLLHDVFHSDTETAKHSLANAVPAQVETVIPGHGPACNGPAARQALTRSAP